MMEEIALKSKLRTSYVRTGINLMSTTLIVRVAYQGLTYMKWNTGLSVPFCVFLDVQESSFGNIHKTL